eukprot:6191881-Pleurochrysis_carterae.AAC.1
MKIGRCECEGHRRIGMPRFESETAVGSVHDGVMNSQARIVVVSWLIIQWNDSLILSCRAHIHRHLILRACVEG